MFYQDSKRIYRVAGWERHAWLGHGFGTRHSLEWPPEPFAWVQQVHSDRCLFADGGAGCLGQGDALLTNTPGVWLTVRTADCIPILLVDSRARAVAAVHAGWKGSAQRVVGKTAEEMARRFSSKTEDLSAAIGPGVCGRCYTVGPEVAAQFRQWFPERNDLDRHTTLDLAEANRRQLVEAGVDAGRIAVGAPCTSCQPEEFHSYRRTHSKTGRMVSAIRIEQ